MMNRPWAELGPLDEVTEILVSSHEWQDARAELVEGIASGLITPAHLLQASRSLLDRHGLGPEAVLASVPSEFHQVLTPEVREQVSDYIAASMAASLLSGAEGGTQVAPVPEFLGGYVRVAHYDVDEGVSVPVVMALVTPLSNPDVLVADLLATCYRSFPVEVFARPVNGARDADWWGRHASGETYADIALSDARAGLAPEARADPSGYELEVRKAAGRVSRAVRRFHRRWTQRLGIVSEE